MSNKPMSTYTIGNNSYEITDAFARQKITEITDEMPSKLSDLQNDTNYITGLIVLDYGTSTWQDFLNAYNAKKIVYCRCNVSGAYRYAFLAYVSNSQAEFQYYRSVNAHTEAQQGDQVFIYTLKPASGGTWSTTTREASSQIIAGEGLTTTYVKDKLTLSSNITNTTYSLSISNNIITLTGSDNSTSTVTLPVYNGEVSST